jgi:prepilin-type N-terminal cleavage/methylation domain-containing protein
MANRTKKAFTVLELLVALAVTAVLSGLLLTISVQVLNTQKQSSNDLETNQVAQLVLDRIEEDLQCAIFRNDGNVWMELSMQHGINTDWQEPDNPNLSKPDSVRYLWATSSMPTSTFEGGPLKNARFGKASVWLKFFTQAPDMDIDSNNSGGARAIGYQLIRHGVTAAPKSSRRYQLYRSDISERNTFQRGYNLPDYSENPHQNEDSSTLRVSSAIKIPINSDPAQANVFSLAINIIEFGVRAYVVENKSTGSGNLIQIFPYNETNSMHSLKCKSNPKVNQDEGRFPDVMDVMIKVISNEGARILERYEEGLVKKPEELSNEEYWWQIAEQYSATYIRRIKIYGQGI